MVQQMIITGMISSRMLINAHLISMSETHTRYMQSETMSVVKHFLHFTFYNNMHLILKMMATCVCGNKTENEDSSTWPWRATLLKKDWNQDCNCPELTLNTMLFYVALLIITETHFSLHRCKILLPIRFLKRQIPYPFFK